MIVFNDIVHGRMVAKAAGTHFNAEINQVIARQAANGKLLAGVIYDGYTGVSIRCHIASFSPNWLSKDYLWTIFDYPFTQCGVRKIIVQIKETNLKSLEFVSHLGFKEEVRIKDVFPEGDCVVMSMYRDQCRWLDIKQRTWANKELREVAHG